MITPKQQLGFVRPLAILIVVILIIAGGVGYYFYKTSQEQRGGSFEEAILLGNVAEKVTKTGAISGKQDRYYKFWIDEGQKFLVTISGDVEVWICYPDHSSALRLEREEGTRGAPLSARFDGYHYIVVQSFDSGRHIYTLTVQEFDETTDLSTEAWKVYKNEKHGFSFAYPRNFRIVEDYYCGVSSLYVENPVVFEFALIQDIYIHLAQNPVICLEVVKTDKTIKQLLDYLKEAVNKRAKLQVEDPQSPYYGWPPPEIESVETITIGDLEMTKVVHYTGPGAPLTSLLQYYVTRPGYVFVFSVNYDIRCGTGTGGDCGATEKETLSRILSTFKFIK